MAVSNWLIRAPQVCFVLLPGEMKRHRQLLPELGWFVGCSAMSLELPE
jgi:hypothetical protein